MERGSESYCQSPGVDRVPAATSDGVFLCATAILPVSGWVMDVV